jgi:signal transduction histidine kinase/DNA-binding response OmpR family regulator
MINHQHDLYIIKELTSLHINKIMDALKEQEYRTKMVLLKEKNESLQRSATFVAFIGTSALIIAVFFMSWTLQSLNKARRLQKSIQEAKKHAEKLLISREQLIYTITHDIKAPLSSIIGFLDLMSEGGLSQKQQYYVNNMHSSSSYILELVRNLLDFHSIEKKQFQLTTVVFSPASLIHSIYESFLPLAQKKQLVFEQKSSLPEKKTFLSDPYYIRQVVNNLLSHAIKYTPEKGRVTLFTSLEEQNRWKISIQDTGPGIAPTDQAKIFVEFIRLNETKREMEGSGLGLPISKQLANLLGGSIEIESSKEIGSVFTLTIPLYPTAESTILQEHKTIESSPGRILFVDDDQVQLTLFSELMKREDWPCICCSSANEALYILQNESFDIIFTDLHIPDMKGFELIKRIRESDSPQIAAIPVIAFSADSQKSTIEMKATGFNEFLFKPFTSQQLLDVIEKHTSLKRKIDEIHQAEDEYGWNKIIHFVADDQEAAMKIIDSFIEETNKDRDLLNIAFQKKDNEAIKRISHKMLTLMRMIPAQEIVSILTEFEKGAISKEKRLTLLRLLEDKIKEAEVTRQMVIEN